MLVYRSVCNATIDGRNPKQPLEMYKTPVIWGEFSKTLGISENTFKHFPKEASLNCNTSFRWIRSQKCTKRRPALLSRSQRAKRVPMPVVHLWQNEAGKNEIPKLKEVKFLGPKWGHFQVPLAVCFHVWTQTKTFECSRTRFFGNALFFEPVFWIWRHTMTCWTCTLH